MDESYEKKIKSPIILNIHKLLEDINKFFEYFIGSLNSYLYLIINSSAKLKEILCYLKNWDQEMRNGQ